VKNASLINQQLCQLTTNVNPVIQTNPSRDVGSWIMKDGTQVTIRPIRADDEPLMVKFHATLSDRTVYMRYFTSLSLARRTAHERLVRICYTDRGREIVLVAEHEGSETGERDILGVGRLNKLKTEGEAEIAVLVSDEHQHKGLGTELLQRLIGVARDLGVSRIVAEMLRDNIAIQSIFRMLGFRLRLLCDPASVQAFLDL
jgi:acetyltransferase